MPIKSPSSWRLVRRDGSTDVRRRNLPHAPLEDLYHLLLTASWAKLFALYAAAFLAMNSLFALLYLAGGDTIANAHSPWDALFFSIQTMCTIGFGVLAPRGVYANVLVSVEAFIGVAMFSLATGIAFSKFSRPTARVLFSNVAVIRPWRGGKAALMFRMANARANRIVDAHVAATLVRPEHSAGGGTMRHFRPLPLTHSHAAFFALSWTAVHVIDAESPLYRTSSEDLQRSASEIVVTLVGYDEPLAQTVHARHSYVPSEIVWDAQFVDIVSADAAGHPVLDYAHFHDVVPLKPEAGEDVTEVG